LETKTSTGISGLFDAEKAYSPATDRCDAGLENKVAPAGEKHSENSNVIPIFTAAGAWQALLGKS